MSDILLGFEVGSGNEVRIPLKHLAITGQTQEAGKTTALEALITRSGLRGVTFITKRGESSFVGARRVDPYFREQADWQFVASILEAHRSEKLKFERAWIIRASRGAKTLADVQRNVQVAMEKAKGMSADVYLTLDAYLEAVVPQIERVNWATSLDLRDGINAVDLTHLNVEMQHLVIKSTVSWVLNKEKNTIIVIPEAWKFIPQGRGTPVKLAAEAFIRQGAALGNYLWLDSQDIAGIDKIILKSVPVWILGVQREANEIKRTLDNIPAGLAKPKAADIATLELGQFFACWKRHSIKTYVQPTWMADHVAITTATTELSPPAHVLRDMKPKEEPNMVNDQQLAEALTENEQLRNQIRQLKDQLRDLQAARPDNQTPAPNGDSSSAKLVQTGEVNINAIERTISVTFSQEKRAFVTSNVKGMIMFTLAHDFKNVPSGESEISFAMQERGWVYHHNTLAPEIGKLVKDGDLLREGATRGVKYRIPGKLRLVIDGEKP